MRKIAAGFVVMAATVSFAGSGLAQAPAERPIAVEIRNAPPNVAVAIIMSAANESKRETAVVGASGLLATALSFGNLGKSERTQVTVYLEDCEDGHKVYFVAAGGEPPEDCDRETENDDCDCRSIGIIWIGPETRTVTIDWRSGSVATDTASTGSTVQSGRGLTVGVSLDTVHFTGASENIVSPAGTTTLNSMFSDSGTDFNLLVGYRFSKHFGVFAEYENLAQAELNRTLDLVELPGVVVEQHGFFDPKAFGGGASFTYPWLHWLDLQGLVGATWWTAESGNTSSFMEDGTVLAAETTTQTNSGVSILAGGQVVVHVNEWIAFAGGYRYKSLKDGDDVNEPVHAGTVMILVNLFNPTR